MDNLNTYIAQNLLKINKYINPEDYTFLNTNPHLHSPILLGLGGSHAYGTNTATSDMDIRGIALNSKEEILLGNGFEQVVNEATDTTIYSLKKIVSLLTNCNPNTIEMLGLKPEHYLYLSPAGEELLKHKDMFLSNRCIKSFMGYANSQLYRLRQKTTVAMTAAELNSHICKTLNGMQDMLEKNHSMEGIKVHLKNEQIVLDLNLKDYPVDDLSAVLGVFNNTLREYRGASQRNEKAIAHGKIAKHSMHLLRLYMMCEDMVLKGEINTYREKEHDLLMSIRNGEFLGKDGKPNKEFFQLVEDYDNRLQKAKENSVLPDKPDIEQINKFLIEINERVVSEGI